MMEWFELVLPENGEPLPKKGTNKEDFRTNMLHLKFNI